jgi:short-subunit dehydrogenase
MKKAIIIGGTTGIGHELANTLVHNNYKVIITGIEKDIIIELEQQNNPFLTAKFLDCINDNGSNKIAELTQELDSLDLLIFSAGIGHLNKNLGFKVENNANKLNVLAFTEIADWSYRFFEKQGYGHFTAISSIAGLFGYYAAPAYHAAKSYQINYLEGLRQKAFKSGKPIYITDIRPGFVATQMTEGKKQFWTVTKEKAATLIFDYIRNKKDVGYVSKRWVLIALILKLIPYWARKRL